MIFLSVEQAAGRYGLSKWEVYERTRLNELPLIVHPGKRRVLIPLEWLDAFDAGDVELEIVETRNGTGVGRVVRPKNTTNTTTT
jgi:hypothetical protein